MNPITAEPPSYQSHAAARRRRRISTGNLAAAVFAFAVVDVALWNAWQHRDRSLDPNRPLLQAITGHAVRSPELTSIERQLLYPPQVQSIFELELELEREPLKAGETCLVVAGAQVGTVIVRSVVAGVPTIRQVIENGRPVECIGDQRL